MSSKRNWLLLIGVFAFSLLAIAYLLPEKSAQPPSWSEALEKEYGAPAYKSIDPNKNVMGQKIRLQIGDRKFEIPKVYISSPVKDGDKVDGLNLIYVMPNFTSRSAFKSKEEYKAAFNAHRFGHMLIRSKAVSTPVSEIFEIKKRTGRITKSDGKRHNLTYYPDPKLAEEKRRRYVDHYIEQDDQYNVVGLIDCTYGDSIRVPGCNYYFDIDALQYDVHFNKNNFLANWQEIRRDAIDFIESFSIQK